MMTQERATRTFTCEICGLETRLADAVVAPTNGHAVCHVCYTRVRAVARRLFGPDADAPAPRRDEDE